MDSVVFFQKHFPEWVEDMQQSQHHYDWENLSPHHLEGDVWAHQMMVMAQVRDRGYGRTVNIAALCHDLGKPACREEREDRKRARFHGHGGVGVFMGSQLLKVMDDESFLSFNNVAKQEILELVSWHQDIYPEMDEFNNVSPKTLKLFGAQPLDEIRHLLELMMADGMGRFASDHKREMDLEHVYNQFYNAHSEHDQKIALVSDEKTRRLYVLVGPPLSGKSTWWKENLGMSTYPICRDDVLMELAPGDLDYNEAWKVVDQKEVDHILNEKWMFAKREHDQDIVVDMTNMSRKSRRRWLNGLPKNMEKVAVVFATPLHTIGERNVERSKEGKHIEPEVLVGMMKRFSAPTLSEFDSVEWVF